MGLHSDNVIDVATCSNFKDVTTKHIHLDFLVNFDEMRIYSTIEISLMSLKDDLKTVSLDVYKSMFFKEAREKGTGKLIPFAISPFADYGSHMMLELPSRKSKNEEFVILISYIATESPGVCWLEPAQTADKTHPFLYTQGQAVMNRCLFPCQDTPAVKAPYTATIKVPEGFKAIMSANHSSYGEVENIAGDKDCYHFKMTVPIQSYLIALAAGNLESASIGPRSDVYAEPSMLPKAQAEFDGIVEDFLKAGEKLFGDYVWGRYDILIMPPSFPFGGMENPCLTFVTPCIVVGDKSLADVVIHEISHSWFGNLVTNANWSEFWLNEGFTMFAQRRIQDVVMGEAFTCLEARTGLALLKRHVDQEGSDHPLTKLRVEIAPGVDPDDTYNETPYEKGYSFVCYLQSLVGDVKEFDDFLKAYVKHFQYKSIVAEDLFDFFLDYFPKLKEEKVDEKPGLEFSMWLNSPGYPVYTPDLSKGHELTDPAERVSEVLAASDGELSQVPDISKWGTYQILHMLDKLAECSPFSSATRVDEIAKAVPFLPSSHNAEVRLRWCEIIIKNDSKAHFDNIRQFLNSQGKLKYTKPLYQAMAKGSKEVKVLAKSIFDQTRDNLHSSVRDLASGIIAQF